MAGIYAADIFCDECIEKIKDEICNELWERRENAVCPDGTEVAEFDSFAELNEYLRGMDERHYDSGEYPKDCDDSEESDCPQHCAAGEDCVNAEVCSDGSKYGYFFGNDLTSEGDDYVREAVREALEDGRNNSPAVELWKPCYDYIDYGPEDNCVVCGEWTELNDDNECADCGTHISERYT